MLKILTVTEKPFYKKKHTQHLKCFLQDILDNPDRFQSIVIQKINCGFENKGTGNIGDSTRQQESGGPFGTLEMSSEFYKENYYPN